MALTIKVDSVTESKGVYHAYIQALDGDHIVATMQLDYEPAKETTEQFRERVRAAIKPQIQGHLERKSKIADLQAALGTLDPEKL